MLPKAPGALPPTPRCEVSPATSPPSAPLRRGDLGCIPAVRRSSPPDARRHAAHMPSPWEIVAAKIVTTAVGATAATEADVVADVIALEREDNTLRCSMSVPDRGPYKIWECRPSCAQIGPSPVDIAQVWPKWERHPSDSVEVRPSLDGISPALRLCRTPHHGRSELASWVSCRPCGAQVATINSAFHHVAGLQRPLHATRHENHR